MSAAVRNSRRFFYIFTRLKLKAMNNSLLKLAGMLLVCSCSVMKDTKNIGSIEQMDASLRGIIDDKAVIEVLGEGYEWSEGPVWVEAENMLLFSDVPKNTIHKWTEANGVEVYLTPSGYTGSTPSESKEPGSNGLTLDNQGKLVLAQHGDRRIARMDAPLSNPKSNFSTVADRYQGRRFNSPNDVVCTSSGEFFFTDPPYGLPKQENDPTREILFQGVYKIKIDGNVVIVTDSLTRPNGVAVTPDGRTLIVANSDPGKARWYAFDLEGDSVSNSRVFFDATEFTKSEQGLPDGLKIDKQGNIFATGPGGVWIFNKDAKVLGKIKLPVPSANCALSTDEKTLYITADNYLLRVKMRK